MRVFIDTNVILDVVIQRQPHVVAALAVWNLVEESKVKACISAISFNNVHYLMRKLATRQRRIAVMDELMDLFEVVSLDRPILERSVRSPIADFEDAIQYASAVRARVTHIVTRDRSHFLKGELPVISPGEFLTLVGAEGLW